MSVRSAVWLVVLAGCPSDSGNPGTLWLSPTDAEIHVALIDHEPPPF